ncbi:LysE family translocator [Pseudomonas sp. PGPPP2]|uniref:LysE family translocator n=1 Tax=Pseudomonas sp. PGPPP2 TaxID=2015554 RepID=UPI000BD6C3BD|nr:LysE family translocator [Pseudomonas sp. PGPPP2]OYT80890.1 MAG: lysine transporter LysE [Pseudomonas sp. PGPPP2]
MLSAIQTLLPFVLFTFVASITPGPTNILILNNSARYGFRAALPIVFGACFAATGIVIAVGSGFGYSLTNSPDVQKAMQWVGVFWLTYLAWQIFCSSGRAQDAQISNNAKRGFGVLEGASIQLVNPKTWMMALAVASVFAGNGSERQIQVLYLSVVFLAISIPCLMAWALLGSGSSRLILSEKSMRNFNRGMAVLLLISAWLSFWKY